MRRALILGAAGAIALVGSALADKYTDVAGKAQKLNGAGDVAGLFWSATADCSKAGSDLARRQCEGVRAARGDAASTGTYIASGDGLSFQVGDWDEKKGGVPIAVYGCIACEKPADVGGAARYLVTKGDVKLEGGSPRGPAIHKALRKFKNEADAKKWKDTVVPRLRTQFVFKLPGKPAEWSVEGAKGFSVEMLAFRVYDPCDGAMICSNPPSEDEKADRAACKGGTASGTDIEGGGGDVKPKEPELPKEPEDDRPDRLSSHDINKSMQKTRTAVNACFATYQVPGKAELSIEIGGDGVVKKVELRGEFKGTPTGDCIIEAAKSTEFRPFKAASMTINYPFILR